MSASRSLLLPSLLGLALLASLPRSAAAQGAPDIPTGGTHLRENREADRPRFGAAGGSGAFIFTIAGRFRSGAAIHGWLVPAGRFPTASHLAVIERRKFGR